MEDTGCIQSTKDIRDYKIKMNNSVEPPSAFILDTVPVKAQGGAPTCTAHVLAQIVEYHTMKESGEFHRYSTNYIYGNKVDTEHEGMSYREGLDLLRKNGDLLYEECPGNYSINQAKKSLLDNDAIPAEDSKITAYYKIKTLQEIMQSLIVDGPVCATMRNYDYKLNDGVYCPDFKSDYTDHAVMIIGWTDDALILQNSWGKHWGKQGKFYVKFNDIDDVFVEFYGVTDDIQTVVRPSAIKKKVAKPINLILNLIISIVKFFINK